MKKEVEKVREELEKSLEAERKGAIETKGGLRIPRDPSIDPAQFAGMWADRDDITTESLRRKAWGDGHR
jgi:hypothetical protein